MDTPQDTRRDDDEKERRPRGRSARVRRQVFEAALAILVRDGRPAISMEAVAGEAGVHKTTLYRRWGTVEQILREACAHYDDTSVHAPDTGTLDGDILELAHQFGRYIAEPISQAIIRMVVSDAPHDAELSDWAAGFWLTRSGPFDKVVERAIERGEISDEVSAIDIAEPLVGPMILRALVTGFDPRDEDFIERIAALVTRGLAR